MRRTEDSCVGIEKKMIRSVDKAVQHSVQALISSPASTHSELEKSYPPLPNVPMPSYTSNGDDADEESFSEPLPWLYETSPTSTDTSTTDEDPGVTINPPRVTVKNNTEGQQRDSEDESHSPGVFNMKISQEFKDFNIDISVKIQRIDGNGTQCLTSEQCSIIKDITVDILRLATESSSIESYTHREKIVRQAKVVKAFFRRIWKGMKEIFTSCHFPNKI
nr:uncharacterized protein LOC129423698 [Misgurnus anguillicaudatus]